MSEHLILDGGAWVDLRDPATVTERHRRPIVRLAGKLNASGLARQLKAGDEEVDFDVDTLDTANDLNDLVAIALVERWSFEVPVSVDALQDLTGKQYDALRAATAKHFMALLPDFSPSPDPDSPSVPSQP